MCGILRWLQSARTGGLLPRINVTLPPAGIGSVTDLRGLRARTGGAGNSRRAWQHGAGNAGRGRLDVVDACVGKLPAGLCKDKPDVLHVLDLRSSHAHFSNCSLTVPL